MGNILKTIDNTIIEYKIVVDFNVPVAQLDLEQKPSKLSVTGSNPVGNATLKLIGRIMVILKTVNFVDVRSNRTLSAIF